MMETGRDYTAMWAATCDVIAKSLLAILPVSAGVRLSHLNSD